MLSKPNIVVGTDFSSNSDLALRAGEKLRSLTNGELYLVHISSYPDDWAWLNNELMVNYDRPNLKDELVRNLYLQLERQAKKCGARCTKEVLIGQPFKGLQESLSSKNADLLIISHKGAGDTHLMYGSLASKLVSSSKVPVLIVKKDLDIKKVAGLVDPEEPFKEIITLGEEISFLLSAELQLVVLVQDLSAKYSKFYLAPPGEHFTYTPEERGNIISNLKRMLSEMVDPHSKSTFNIKITENPSVSSSLNEMLVENDIGLGILRRHNRTLMENFILGSVTKRMIENFEGNLLILPP